jgi:hypothetical protein
VSIIRKKEEKKLTVQEIDAKLKPEQDFLCQEVKVVMVYKPNPDLFA